MVGRSKKLLQGVVLTYHLTMDKQHFKEVVDVPKGMCNGRYKHSRYKWSSKRII